MRARSLIAGLSVEVIYHDETSGMRTSCKRWRHSYHPPGEVRMSERYAAQIGRLCKDCERLR